MYNELMEQILSHGQAANLMICLVLAIHLLSVRARVRLPAQMLGANYLMHACQSFLLIGWINEMSLPYMYIIRPVSAMLIGPVFYFYFLSVKRLKPKFKAVDYLHFIPSLLLLLAFITQSPILFATDYFIIGSLVLYLVLVAIPMLQGKKMFSHLETEPRQPYKWLCVLAMLMLVNIGIDVAVVVELETGKALNQSLALFLGTSFFLIINLAVAYVIIRRNPLVEWMYELSLRTFSEKEFVSAQNKECFVKWEALVASEQLHKRDFGITLSEAAKKLQIPSRQLSNAINLCYGKSFSQYLNDKRVSEAQHLIQTNPEMTMIEVMNAAGFSTKSNFNKEFQRVLGMPPSKYRLSLLRGC